MSRRVPRGRRPVRPAAGARRRTGQAAGRRHRRGRRPGVGARRAQGDRLDPDRVHHHRRSGAQRSRRQPEPAGRQRHRHGGAHVRARRQAARTAAAAQAAGEDDRRADQSEAARRRSQFEGARRPRRRRSAARWCSRTAVSTIRSTPRSASLPNARSMRCWSPPTRSSISAAPQVVALAAQHRIPAVYQWREFVDRRRPDELRAEHRRRLSAGRRLCRTHSQGRQARRICR